VEAGGGGKEEKHGELHNSARTVGSCRARRRNETSVQSSGWKSCTRKVIDI
jgi:hypothetical protein